MKLYIKTTQYIQINEGSALSAANYVARPDKGAVAWLANGIANHNDDPLLCAAFTAAITPPANGATVFDLPEWADARGISAFSGENLVPMRLLSSTVRAQIGQKVASPPPITLDNNVTQPYWFGGNSIQQGPVLQPSVILQRPDGELFTFPQSSSFLSNSGLHSAPNYLLSDNQVIYDAQFDVFMLTRDWQLLAPSGLSGPVNTGVLHPVMSSNYPFVSNKPADIENIITYARLSSIHEIEITDRALDSGGGIVTPVGIAFSIPAISITAPLTDSNAMSYSVELMEGSKALLIRLNDLLSHRQAATSYDGVFNSTDPKVLDSTFDTKFEVSNSPLQFKN